MCYDAPSPACWSDRSWLSPPEACVLGREAVHVWRACLDLPEPLRERLARTLSHDERSRAARFRFAVHRDHFIAARGILRDVLARYTGQDAPDLAFEYGPHGKPVLRREGADGVRFNLTHSGGVALLAVARGREVGIDIEELRRFPDAESIARRFFSVPERDALLALPVVLRQAAFFTCWTRKEAVVKGIGEGLSFPLDSFAVTLAPGEPAHLRHTDGTEVTRWTLWELPPLAGYAAALAVEGTGYHLSCWDWTPREPLPGRSGPPSGGERRAGHLLQQTRR